MIYINKYTYEIDVKMKLLRATAATVSYDFFLSFFFGKIYKKKTNVFIF